MKTYRDKIWALIEHVVASRGMELIEVECRRMKTRFLVRIFLDKEGGVTLDDCQEISHLAGDILDVHDIPPGPYTLEVSSPGLDRPLTRSKDFLKYRGRMVTIRTAEKLEGIRNFHGRLVDYIEEDARDVVTIEVEGKIYRIPRDMIVKANIEYEF
ncbi:MAG: ribosome maturation factor RimP [Syntrophales bacterium]